MTDGAPALTSRIFRCPNRDFVDVAAYDAWIFPARFLSGPPGSCVHSTQNGPGNGLTVPSVRPRPRIWVRWRHASAWRSVSCSADFRHGGRPTRHVGRHRCRVRTAPPLVDFWRAPAARPSYQATASCVGALTREPAVTALRTNSTPGCRGPGTA